MSKTRKNLEQRGLLLSKLILNNADLYHAAAADEQGLLETLVGAGIWYLPNTPDLFNGKISQAALEQLRTNPYKTKLVEEHAIPRKVAGKLLFTEYLEDLKMDPAMLVQLYLERFGKYNLVLKEENDRLKKFQRTGVFTNEEEAYANAGITLTEFTYQDYQEFKRNKRNALAA